MLVLVSYIPLLRGSPGKLVDPAEVAPLLDTDAGHVDAIAWAAGDDGELSPVLAMDRANDVFDHLVEWSEGAPATWFKLVVDESDDEYAMALVPDAQRSLDRFLLAWSLLAGTDVPSADEVRVLFQPLVFRGPKSDVSRRALPLLRGEVTIGFLDVRELSAGDARLDPRSGSRVGPLPCERGRGLLPRT